MKLLVVSNMYPSKGFPAYGTFVKRFVELAESVGSSCVLSVMRKARNRLEKVIRYLFFYLGTFARAVFGNYDVIYVHYASYSSPPVLAALKFRKVCVWTNVHGSDVIPENAKQQKMLRNTERILLVSDKVVVPSEYYRSVVSERFGITSGKIIVYPSSGVDESLFQFLGEGERQRMKESFGFAKDSFIVGFVGRLIPGKGWEFFIDLCSALPSESFQFIMVGSGSQEHFCESLINERGLAGRTKKYSLLSQEKLSLVYSACDILCSASSRPSESLCLVSIEALCCGTPVLIYDSPAQREYIHDGYNGFVVESDSVDEACSRIQTYRSLSSEQRNEMRIHAHESSRPFHRNECRSMLRVMLSKSFAAEEGLDCGVS